MRDKLRDKSGFLGSLMVGSAIALALMAAPYSVDWASWVVDTKVANAKSDGKGGGHSQGGSHGNDSNKNDKGRDGGKHDNASKGRQSGKAGRGEGKGVGPQGNGEKPDNGDQGNRVEAGSGKANKESKGKKGAGVGGDTDGSTGDAAMPDADRGSSTPVASPDQTEMATATTSTDGTPAPSAILRTAAARSSAAVVGVTVSIRTVHGLPPSQQDGPEERSGLTAPAPAIALAVRLPPATCGLGIPSPAKCPALDLNPAAGPAPPPTRPAIPAAAAIPRSPNHSPPDRGQMQIAYAVPKIDIEPEPPTDISENIYGLMQVEAVRYIDSTIPILVVQGLVFNMSRSKREVPPLVAIVRDDRNRELARWRFVAEAPILKPGASTGFRTETVDPAPQSTKVTVIFAPEEQPQMAGREVPILPR